MVMLAPSLKIFCPKLIEIVLNNVLQDDMEVYQIFSFPNCVRVHNSWQFWGVWELTPAQDSSVYHILQRQLKHWHFKPVIWEAIEPGELGDLSKVTWWVYARAGICQTLAVWTLNHSLRATFTIGIKNQKRWKLFKAKQNRFSVT